MFSLSLGVAFVIVMVGWSITHQDLMHRLRQRAWRIALSVGGPLVGLTLACMVFSDFIRDGRMEYVNSILTYALGVAGAVVAVWRPFREPVPVRD